VSLEAEDLESELTAQVQENAGVVQRWQGGAQGSVMVTWTSEKAAGCIGWR